jgi:beta-glucosidase
VLEEAARDEAGAAATGATGDVAAAPTADAATAEVREIGRERRLDGRLEWHGDPRIAGRPIVEFATRVISQESGRHRIGLGVRGRVAIWIDGQLAYEGGEIPDTQDIDGMWHDPPCQAVEVEMTAGRPVEVVMRWRKFYDQGIALIEMSIEKPVFSPEAALAEAEKLAGEADAVVLLVGTTSLDESEGHDRTSLALQPEQDELVARVAAVNARTVVVVSAGAPVLMPWRNDVGAVLLTWFPGQEAGNALADILLGRVEPGGRLPTTWPATMEDVPILDTQPVNGRLHYAEGLHIGYRAWLRAETAPAWPFGHGHGYTSWTYLDVAPAMDGDGPAVEVRIHNSGSRAGREVVQLYLARPDSSIERPLLWLGGFIAVEAGPGQTVVATVPIDRWALRHWDEAAGAWAVEPGRFEVRVGRSVGDLRLATYVEVEGQGS